MFFELGRLRESGVLGVPTVTDSKARYKGQARWITDVTQDKPVRQPLSRRRVVLAALALAEQEGLEAVTMRRVAAELDVTAMSLYNHVADKAELLDLMVDYVIGDVVRASGEDAGPWDERLRTWVLRNRDLWRQHPMFARIYTEGVTIGPHGLANIERGVGILREAGLSDRDAGGAFLVLWRYTLGSVLLAPARPVDPSHRVGPRDETPQGRIETYFSALPMEEIPNVVAGLAHFAGGSFDLGLELIICGLRERVAAADATVVKPRSGRRRTTR